MAEHVDATNRNRSGSPQVGRYEVERIPDRWVEPGSLDEVAGDAFVRGIGIQCVLAERQHVLPPPLQQKRKRLVGNCLRLRRCVIVCVGEERCCFLVIAEGQQTRADISLDPE